MNLRKLFNYVGIYTAGVGISTSFVLWTNDIFYNVIFRRMSPVSGKEVNIWEEIKPREIMGMGAKKTFIKHKIEQEENQEIRDYYNYLEKRRDENTQKIYEDIYSNNKK